LATPKREALATRRDLPIQMTGKTKESRRLRSEACAKIRNLLEGERRAEGTRAVKEIGASDRYGGAAGQQAGPSRVVVQHAAPNADDVAGALRLETEAGVGEDDCVRDGRYVCGALNVYAARIGEDVGVLDGSVSAIGAARHVDAVPREVMNAAPDDVQLASRKEVHTLETRPQALDVETFENDRVGRGRRDDNAVRPGHQHAGFNMVGSDGDRLGDGHRTETTGVENVDFARGRSLRDRAGKCLARCGAAARVGIITNAGDPSPRRLSASRRHSKEWNAGSHNQGHQSYTAHSLP